MTAAAKCAGRARVPAERAHLQVTVLDNRALFL